jgi:hypothetical protein
MAGLLAGLWPFKRSNCQRLEQLKPSTNKILEVIRKPIPPGPNGPLGQYEYLQTFASGRTIPITRLTYDLTVDYIRERAKQEPYSMGWWYCGTGLSSEQGYCLYKKHARPEVA